MKVRRKCPICNWEGPDLRKHAHKKHPQYSDKEFLALYLRLPEVPKCPICGKEVVITSVPNKFTFGDTCSNHCQRLLRQRDGRSPFGYGTKVWADHEKEIAGGKFVFQKGNPGHNKLKQMVKDGTHPFLKGNKVWNMKQSGEIKKGFSRIKGNQNLYVGIAKDYVKVGISVNPMSRLRYFNSLGAEFEGYYESLFYDNKLVRKMETKIHKEFSEYNTPMNFKPTGPLSAGNTEYFSLDSLSGILNYEGLKWRYVPLESPEEEDAHGNNEYEIETKHCPPLPFKSGG